MRKLISVYVLCFTILSTSESVWAEDWPTYMHDGQRSGVTGEKLELPLDLLETSLNNLKSQIDTRDDFLRRKKKMGLIQ